MKNLKILSVLILGLIFLSSCNKDTVDQKSSEKLNEKKEAISDQKTTETKQVTAGSNDIELYKIEKVDKSSGKKVAPNFTWMKDGKEVSLKDMKGKVVLVNLWATWCKPCIKEMPDLSAISEELKGKDFEMIGVNVFQQNGSKKVEDFLATNPVSYVILDGNQEIVDALSEADGASVEAVPTTFLIDKNGKIVETIIGGRSKETFLASINKYLN
ncbi:MAG TPA: TlpA disulfide reductase family protein [Ignavibacteria bacterium]|nr:TlpA disulfide reductase family protein [Ignavibacteria bacterium]HMR40535.1 TlpA disulfide reductase family protein [Ignavibacteria bacterium]